MDTSTTNDFHGPMPEEPYIDPRSSTGTPIDPSLSSEQNSEAWADETMKKKQPSLSNLLATVKLIGAATIAAAMALFLFEGIEVTNDIQRFLSILGFGALLTGLGLAVNKWLSDRVASRLFIGLSLGSIPVIATVLGGFTFSLTDAAKSLSLPQFATWEVANTASLFMTLPIALIVICVITALGLMVMARSEVRWLTPALFLSNALLLIPTRDSTTVALIAAVAIALLVWVVRKKQVNPISFKTLEGRWALAILFLAPAIMIVRSAIFYQPDIASATLITLTLYLASRYLFHRCKSGSKREIFALLATVVSSATAVFCIVVYAAESSWIPFTDSRNSESEIIAVFSLLTLLASFDFARKNNDWYLSRLMNTLACVVVGVGVVCSTLFIGYTWVATLLVLTALSTFMLVYYVRGWKIESGILLVLITTVVFQHIDEFIGALAAAGWWGLAAAGTTAVVGSAVMEKTITKRPQAA